MHILYRKGAVEDMMNRYLKIGAMCVLGIIFFAFMSAWLADAGGITRRDVALKAKRVRELLQEERVKGADMSDVQQKARRARQF